MSGIIATHVGVDTKRGRVNFFTCTRCGQVKNVNPRRRKDEEYVAIDRRTYQCVDCKYVLALTEREEAE